MTALNIALCLSDSYIADLLSCCNNYNISNLSETFRFYDLIITDNIDLCSNNNLYAQKPLIYIGNQMTSDNIVKIEKPFRIINLIDIIEKTKKNISKYLHNKYLVLDKAKRMLNVKSQNQNIILTEKEADFIEFLLNNKFEVTKKTLLKDIWNYNIEDTHTIETLVYRLRQKLGSNSNLIQTTNNGYKLKF